MKIRSLVIASIVALAPAMAHATSTTGVVNWVKGNSNDGTYNSSACFQFEIGNSATISSTTGKYAISSADPLYSDVVSVVFAAYLTGQTLTAIDAGVTLSTCGSTERVVAANLGTLF